VRAADEVVAGVYGDVLARVEAAADAGPGVRLVTNVSVFAFVDGDGERPTMPNW
jgi:hypothetical protein